MTLAQPHFAVEIALTHWWVCFTPLFNAQPDIFAVMNYCVEALSLFVYFPPIS